MLDPVFGPGVQPLQPCAGSPGSRPGCRRPDRRGRSTASTRARPACSRRRPGSRAARAARSTQPSCACISSERAVLAAARGVVGVRQILEPAHQHAHARAADGVGRHHRRLGEDLVQILGQRLGLVDQRGRRARAPARGCAGSSRAARRACPRGRPAPTRARCPWRPARAGCGRSRDSCRRGSTSLQRRVARIARMGTEPDLTPQIDEGARRARPVSAGRRALRPPVAALPAGRRDPRRAARLPVAPRPDAAVRGRAAAGADRLRRHHRLALRDHAPRALRAAPVELLGRRRRPHVPVGRRLPHGRDLLHRRLGHLLLPHPRRGRAGRPGGRAADAGS